MSVPLTETHRQTLVRARESRGWRQADLAAEIGIGQTMVSKIESGAKAPSRDLLDRLAAAMGLEVSVELRVTLRRGPRKT